MSGPHTDRTGNAMSVRQAHNRTDRPRVPELEEQLQHTQKLETLGRLASGVAHDFNNIVTIMTGYSAMLLHQLERQDPLYEAAEGIKKASAWAASLARQLTAFSRKQVIEPCILDLNASVRSLEKVLPRLLGEDIDVVTRLAPTLECIAADPGQIEQIVINLAVNARDAMPMGGRLIIATTNILIDEHETDNPNFHQPLRPGPYVKLSVSDTGCGIPGETRERLFDPFFTSKPAGEGTGLGLTIVHEIVSKSGGAIRVDSTPGLGTTFDIVLPHAERERERVSSSPSGRPLDGSETILLVEDEEPVRVLMRRILEAYGYTILEAPDGKAALWASVRHLGTLDLLLTDVVMPHMSGRELARYMRALHPDMKVLYMSGYAKSAHFPQEVMDGKAPFLSKPFAPDTLVRQVRDVLDVSCQSLISM